MSLSVKRTAEIMSICACHLLNGDIVFEIDGIVQEVVIRFFISDAVAEDVPIKGIFDPVFALQRNGVLREAVRVIWVVRIII